MNLKFYIHHYYSKSLFYKIAHKTKNRKFNLHGNVGSVFCDYGNFNIELIFNPSLSDENDGFHIIDFLTIVDQLHIDDKLKNINCINKKKGEDAHRGKWGAEFGINDIPIMKWIADELENKNNWIIFLLRTEKTFIHNEGIKYPNIYNLETQVKRLSNHFLCTDNCFIDDLIESKYPNHFFVLTNTIHQWNELLSIRWFYEFKNIYEKLNPPFDLCFSMRYHKRNRTRIITRLSNLNNDRIFLSRTDNCKNDEFYKENNNLLKYDNININVWEGDDFEDISWIENIEHYLDYVMRILPMSKIHILSETWDWVLGDLTSNYLSEKTYGLLLSNIPFLPTHSYPLEIIYKILEVEKYPFHDDIKKINGNEQKFVEYVDFFMKNYDNNLQLCKDWVNLCHNKLMNKINNENSFLEMIINGELKFREKKLLKNLI